MIKSKIFFLIVFCFGLHAFGQSTKETVNGNNTFAFELFQKVFSTEKNSFISPYSISSALAMTYAGARNETERQMSEVLHFDLNQVNTHQGFSDLNSSFKKIGSDADIKLSVANALWKSEAWGFKKEFLELTKKYYDAAIYPLKGAKPINEWADKNTNGKIKDIVTDEDLANSRLVLTNAIYFKADWLTTFDEKMTHKDKFITVDRNSVDVDMMSQMNDVNYFEDGGNQILELPYKGESITMTLILPKGNNSIDKLVSSIDQKKFTFYESKVTKQRVKISLPRFSFKSKYELEKEKYLPAMGMTDAFDDLKADFSGMSSGLRISKVIHKSFIEINEKGSEAAAVTAVIMIEKTMKNELTFKADKPFMFFICDKQTHSILFMGSVMNPNENE